MSVGEALAEARYRAGLTVDEVSERTKIRETVIRCIEQDDYGACGGDLYVRGYVRAIAGAIGIDAQPLIREYDLGHAGALGSPAAPVASDAAETVGGLDGPRVADTVPAITRPQPILPEVTAVTTIDPATAPGGPATARTRTRRRRVAILVVLAVAVAGVAGGLIVSSLGRTQGKNTTASAAAVHTAHHVTAAAGGNAAKSKPEPKARTQPKPVKASPKARRTAAAVRIRSLPIALAVAFGPDGVTDGDNPRTALFAVRPGSPLPWSSQWYTTANFGLLKHGTGLLIDMGRRVTVTSVRIELAPYHGADLQLRVGNAAVASDLKVSAHAFDAGGTVRLRLRSPERVRYLLIWFTLLPPNGAGQYQASVYRVVVNGP